MANWTESFLKRLGLLALVAAGVAMTGCKPHGQPNARPQEAVRVRVMAVGNKSRVDYEEVVGTVRAKLHAEIEAKVTARIEALLVAPGQFVKAGDPIARLDAREIQARVDQALAVGEQAARDLERARQLLQRNVTTQADFDAVEARERVAAGAVKEATAMLGYAAVVAPFDGVVSRKLADVGDLAAPGKPIVAIEDPRALRLEADVPEALIGRLKIGDKLPLRVSSAAADLEGVVTEMAPVADPASRTFLVKLDLPPADGLRSGQFGRVLVPSGHSTAVWVPASALVVRGQLEEVFVAVNECAQLRLVRTGKRAGNEVELLAGIVAGEEVISEGPAQLQDGQPIVIQP
jgi:RND family efflux transporter MFP subunit